MLLTSLNNSVFNAFSANARGLGLASVAVLHALMKRRMITGRTHVPTGPHCASQRYPSQARRWLSESANADRREPAPADRRARAVMPTAGRMPVMPQVPLVVSGVVCG